MYRIFWAPDDSLRIVFPFNCFDPSPELNAKLANFIFIIHDLRLRLYIMLCKSAACEKVVQKVMDEMEEGKDEDVTPSKSPPVRKEVTEEDLEDWLDSMIS